MPTPAMPPTVTDTIAIRRLVYNTVTKQSAWTTVHSGVPAFINDSPRALAASGMAPQYDAKLVVDQTVDLRDGDQITGYNPLGLAVPPLVVVGHVSPNDAPGMPRATTGVRVGYLNISKKGSAS